MCFSLSRKFQKCLFLPCQRFCLMLKLQIEWRILFFPLPRAIALKDSTLSGIPGRLCYRVQAANDAFMPLSPTLSPQAGRGDFLFVRRSPCK
jgi:hypothetical protein